MLYENIEFEPGEQVLVMVRKHWFIIVAELAGVALAMMLPFVLLAISPMILNPLSMSIAGYGGVITFAIAAWMLLSLLSGFAIWTHYYLDIWIVTDRRIILVDQIKFFSRNVSVFRLERMQDIEYKIKGIIPTLLNFGTIKAQTAGAHESNFNSTGMPDPRGLQATIQKAMDERMRILHIAPDEMTQ